MSLGIAVKAPEGIVLAADSRVTLTTQRQLPGSENLLSENSSFDNATKLLIVNSQSHAGAITYGVGAILTPQPRTLNSFISEFEATIVNRNRMLVEEFAIELSTFYLNHWTIGNNSIIPGFDIHFLVGGYDINDPFGKIFEFSIPNNPTPVEQVVNQFGARWGGQHEFLDRLINGFEFSLPSEIRTLLNLSQPQTDQISSHLLSRYASPVPWAFLPLQDCVDLSIFLIRTTITMQRFLTTTRGVGGAIDVAVIRQSEGLIELQKKELRGE